MAGTRNDPSGLYMDQTVYFPTLDQYKLSPAIAVQAVEGAPVTAAADGTVYSIEEDAQTGTTLTMELGSGYQAVYGQLKDLCVEEGDTVTEGTVIGYVSAPTKYYSKEGNNLYFAMKKTASRSIRSPIFRKRDNYNYSQNINTTYNKAGGNQR